MSAAETGRGGPVQDDPVYDGPVDEFAWIAELLRPLTGGAPEAFNLEDDAAAIPARPGFDLIVSTDAIVEGVHFLPSDPLDLVAGKLLRVNLSDLAAKGADAYGYFLAVAWPSRDGWPQRRAFAAGLGAGQTRFGLCLLGGDTTATPGPLVASATILGWVPAGRMVRRAGARPGDMLMVSGAIGDGKLGLDAARGELTGLNSDQIARLVDRYASPEPRLGFGEAMRRWVHAACDISDGLLADALNIAAASGLGVSVDLDALPVSDAGLAWLSGRSDPVAARLSLAAGGDDYELACAAPPQSAAPLIAAFASRGVALTRVGEFTAEPGLRVTSGRCEIEVARTGYRHL